MENKHAKCSGKATCERCKLRNLECTFIDSGKKRGPKMNDKHPAQVYSPNGSENDFDGTSTLSSAIPNAMQGHASTLSSSIGYPQQQPDNINEITIYSDPYEERNISTFQELYPFSYQAHKFDILPQSCDADSSDIKK
ncbi:21374_t:CDS:2 [Cetraspora pellucida]|uniref:21374_t:CDS:1 n=1 Tax=Cetraspora pellucida TaxID=1433469 RepID=A0A9N9HY14_9GLOM|nr:21374_t:CDS:2 [Cetraspora pellucida]